MSSRKFVHVSSQKLSNFDRLLIVVFLATCSIFILRTFVGKQVRPALRDCVKPRIYVGVYTDGGGQEKYAKRRASLRTTWFPNTTYARAQLECKYGMTIRFVVGRSLQTNDTQLQQAWHDEQLRHDDFLKLDVVDTYKQQAKKTDEFFRHVMNLSQKFEYVVEVDDDMFVSPSHLSMAVQQWAEMKLDYVGCMIHFKNQGEFEPARGTCLLIAARA